MPDFRGTIGGPTSFQEKLESFFSASSIDVSYSLKNIKFSSSRVLLINSSIRWDRLLLFKKRGIRIFQRLGSPFYLLGHEEVDLKKNFRAWIGMQNMVFIRAHIADSIIYQSRYVQECWEKKYGVINKPSHIIYNGIDLSVFSPEGEKYDSLSKICLISVEGMQLTPFRNTAFLLATALKELGYDVELLIFGKMPKRTVDCWSSYPFVKYRNVVPNHDLPYYYRRADLFILNDIISAGCPNSVIEALACGTPILGYQQGVLPELLTREAGNCVPVEGDLWENELPGNIKGLVASALSIIKNNQAFRKGARSLAEARFSLNHMGNEYKKILFS